MGVDSGDYDGDGRLDLILTAFAHDSNTLYHNRDGHSFEDATTETGLAGPTFVRMGWGTAFFDADLDGHPDLFFANGHIYPNVDDYPQLHESFRQKNQLFLNRGGRFIDVSETAGPGLQVTRSSRGLAVGDLDNDGDLDVVITNMDDVPTVLNNRQTTGHHWVAVQLRKGRRRHAAGPGDSVRRQLFISGRFAGVLRTRLVRRCRGRRGPDARRKDLAMARAADRSTARADARRSAAAVLR